LKFSFVGSCLIRRIFPADRGGDAAVTRRIDGGGGGVGGGSETTPALPLLGFPLIVVAVVVLETELVVVARFTLTVLPLEERGGQVGFEEEDDMAKKS
jgi:hypothetical protein